MKKTFISLMQKLISILFKKAGMSFKTKLMAIFVLLSVFPLSIVGIFSYTKNYETVWDNTTVSTIQLADQLNKNIDLLFSDTEKFLEIGTNDNVLTFLRKNEETYEASKEILNLFKFYRNTYKFNQRINGIYVLGFNGKCINERNGVYWMDPADIRMMTSVQAITKADNEVSIIPSHIPQYVPGGSNKPVISVGRIIRREVTHEVLGVIIIDLDMSAISDFCDNLKIGKTGYFWIANKDGGVVYQPVRMSQNNGLNNSGQIMLNESGSFVWQGDKEKMFIVFNTSVRTGWKIIGEAPLQDIMRDAVNIRNLTVLIVAICLILVVVLYFFISDRITLPIRNLKQKMKLAASGNLDARVEDGRTDEIADLGNSFNKMINKIKVLMETSIREQENLKKAELKAMQAQINPHFLYNTLDTIVWMAANNKSEKVIEITNELSSFFRITLSKGKDWIRVRDEVEHVRNYLAIQKIRYRDIMDYDISVDENILDYRILKLTLQPLVENALYHGIKNKRGGGHISIKGFMADTGGIVFKVTDNGAGMSPERLLEVVSGIQDESADISLKESGFGLGNVNKRIKIYYGKQFGLTLDSETDKGTTVTVTLAAERWE